MKMNQKFEFNKCWCRNQPTVYCRVEWRALFVAFTLSVKTKEKNVQSFQQGDVCKESLISVSKKWTVILWFGY